MEVCVDSLESAMNAFEGRANRIELCSSLNEGGLTPSYGLFKSIKTYLDKRDPDKKFAINCMIRCRSGDFNYTDSELETMFEDVKKFIELDVDGLVFGALDVHGLVDQVAARQFIKLLPVNIGTTFHRAFDVSADWREAYGALEDVGFQKLLTSGQKKTAYEGMSVIRELVLASENKNLNHGVKIIAGCGINSSNLAEILRETKCHEFHASCRSVRQSKMVFRNDQISMGASGSNEYEIFFSDKQKVNQLVNIYNEFIKS
jgi:copper homeostasis protein